MPQPNFIINKYEIVFFLNIFNDSDLLGLANRIKNTVTEFNNQNTAVLPIPKDAPPQIPRILLKSENGEFTCDISFEKIDIFWLNKNEESEFEKKHTLESKIENAKKICEGFQNLSTFKRIGFITEFFYEVVDNKDKYPKNVLGKNAEPRKKLKDYSCLLTFDIKMKSYKEECNQVITIGTGYTNKPPKRDVIIMRSDINTHQNNNFNDNFEKAKEFMFEANKYSQPKNLHQKFILHNGKNE